MCAEDFEELVVQHYDTLLRLSVQHTGSRAEAEDIVQTVFLRVLEADPAFRDAAHAKAYLIRMTINLCKDYLRSARRSRRAALTEQEYDNLPDRSLRTPDENADAVRIAVQMLRPALRDVVYLHYYEGYTVTEIAEILHRSRGTVASWLRRAQKQLKEALNDGSDSTVSERDGPHQGR